MPKFFSNYKTVDYKLFDKTFNLTNITLRFKFKQNLSKNIYNFYDYVLSEGERLDQVADMYYGDSKYVWVIVLVNDMIDPQFQIPRTYDEFRKYVENKYGSWENALNGVHHYERVSVYKDSLTKVADINPPLIISEELYNSDNLLPEEKKQISYLEYEEKLNENKRSIKLLDINQLNLIIELVESVFE